MKIVYTNDTKRCEIHLDTNTIYVNPTWINGIARKYGISINHVVLHELGHHLYNKYRLETQWRKIYKEYNDIIQNIIQKHCYMLKHLDIEETFAEIFALFKLNELIRTLKTMKTNKTDENRIEEFKTQFLELIGKLH